MPFVASQPLYLRRSESYARTVAFAVLVPRRCTRGTDQSSVRYPSSWSSVCIVIICRVRSVTFPYGTRCPHGGFQGRSFPSGSRHWMEINIPESLFKVSGMGNAIRKNPRPFAGSGVPKFTGEPSGKLRLPSERSRQPEEWPLACSTMALKASGSGDGQLGESATIQLDAGKVQALDEAVVGDAFGADGSVDALDPQLAEVAPCEPLRSREVVGKGVQQRSLALRYRRERWPRAGSPLENDATLLVGVYCALDTCHI